MLSSNMPSAVHDRQACKAFIRPERVLVAPAGHERRENSLPGKVTDLVFSGSLLSLTIAIAGGRYLTVERQSGDDVANIGVGADVALTLPADALLMLPLE